jgi:hypothetical protein
MATQFNIKIDNSEPKPQSQEMQAEDLTRKLFEVQTKGLSELYEKLNESISINKIIENNKSFKRSHSTLRKMCQ